MNIEINDSNFYNIVNDILEDEIFCQLKEIEHHGVNRFDHSLKVSYYSYKISRKLGLDCEKTARAGLLHDFFLSDNNRSFGQRFISTFNHSTKAVFNASEHFNVCTKEKDIIKSHMFPAGLYIPKYAESWIVNFVDKYIAINEFSDKLGYRLSYTTNLLVLMFINYIR